MLMINMPLLVVLIGVGIIAGWLAGLVTRGRGFGLPGNILAAIAGAFAGVYLLGSVGVSFGAGFINIAVAGFLGAFLILTVIGWLRR